MSIYQLPTNMTSYAFPRLEDSKTKKNIYYFLGVNFIPIIFFHVCFFILLTLSGIKSNVALVEDFTDIFIIPLYLLIINFEFNIKRKTYFFIHNFFVMLIAIIAGDALAYINWGVTTGLLRNPDADTIMIQESIVGLNIESILVISIVIQIILLIMKKYCNHKIY